MNRCASSQIVSPGHAETCVRIRAARPATGGWNIVDWSGPFSTSRPPSRCFLTVPRSVRWPIAGDQRRMSRPSNPLRARCTDARKTPKHCHFVPLFCALGAAPGRRVRLGKSLPHHGIGLEVRAAGRS
jgi:hypothetical protein